MQNLDKRLNACFLKIIEGNEFFQGERSSSGSVFLPNGKYANVLQGKVYS